MNQRDSSPSALVWLANGHVSDWALNALLDGETTLLPEDAVSHAETCDHCLERMVTMAHSVFALEQELSLLAAHQANSNSTFPLALFTAACLFCVTVAYLSWGTRGATLGELPHELLTVWRGVRIVGPFAARQLGNTTLGVVSSLVTLAAAIGGVILAKRYPYTQSPESRP